MKVLLYFEGEKLIAGSGIGRAQKHQMRALESAGIAYTIDPWDDSFDLLHINTVGMNSSSMVAKARREGRPVVYHGHSTEEDFRNSFVFSNQLAPMVKKRLIDLYSSADVIITPTPYAKSILESYGITLPIYPISNGIDLKRFSYDEEKVRAFRRYFSLEKGQKVVLSVGLYFERKGLLDFMEVAKMLPEYTFIWFGYTNPLLLTKQVRECLDDVPDNVILPGYISGAIIEGAYLDADVFFFPSYEETEGIVVLEALAARQNVLVRDIGVYNGWLKDKENCYMASDNEGFVAGIKGILTKSLPSLVEAGYQVAEARSIEKIGEQLAAVYHTLVGG
ncbi:MAG: glycosyltransferase family 4 protein [Erysipelotrichaceae bacterium]|nr:glycosyltransferase family 4 protein [Erysipelotrichaceae bacterium]